MVRTRHGTDTQGEDTNADSHTTQTGQATIPEEREPDERSEPNVQAGRPADRHLAYMKPQPAVNNRNELLPPALLASNYLSSMASNYPGPNPCYGTETFVIDDDLLDDFAKL